jgi:prolyl oligopeptidase
MTWWHYVGYRMFTAGDGAIAFVHSAFDRSPAICAYDLHTGTIIHSGTPAIRLDGIGITDLRVPADDGAAIPVSIIRKAGDAPERPLPTVIFAYGGYNHAFLPAYLGMFAAMIERGGTLVFAHIRGGGEFGANWWRAGHHERKQRSFDDIYSVAEWLIREGRATSRMLGIVGASNGGMNVAVATTQRPDLFRAAVALVPQCDLLRYGRDLFYGGKPIEGHHNGIHIHGGTWRGAEEGSGAGTTGPSPARPFFFESVYPDPFGYSPYHRVEPGRSYPALLVVSASRDLWCPPWHGRKFIAHLQGEAAGTHSALLRVWPGDGHDAPILGRPEQVVEWVGFFIRELGMG